MSDADAAPLLYLGQRDDATSPRVLVRYTLFETPDAEDVEHHAFDAVQPQGVVDGGPSYERDVLGFAELPRNQPVGRHTDAESFVETIEAKAVYVHWKPSVDEVGVTGEALIEGADTESRDDYSSVGDDRPYECDSCAKSLVSFSEQKLADGVCPFCSDPHTVDSETGCSQDGDSA